MKTRVYADIETLPPSEDARNQMNTRLMNKLVGRKPRLEISTDENPEISDELFGKLGLHAEYGRVLAIGVVVEQNGVITRQGVFGFDQTTGNFHSDEAKTLRGFWALLKQLNFGGDDLIIGHNLMEFDLPFIIKRSRILDVSLTVNFNFAKYRSKPIFDTMREWSLWSFGDPFLKLDELAEILNLDMQKTEGIDGSTIYENYLAGNHPLIAEYCLQDVLMTRAIFRKLTGESVGKELALAA